MPEALPPVMKLLPRSTREDVDDSGERPDIDNFEYGVEVPMPRLPAIYDVPEVAFTDRDPFMDNPPPPMVAPPPTCSSPLVTMSLYTCRLPMFALSARRELVSVPPRSTTERVLEVRFVT